MTQLAVLAQQPVLTKEEYCTTGEGALNPYVAAGQPILTNGRYLVTSFTEILPPEPEPAVEKFGDPSSKRHKPKRSKPQRPLQLEKGLEYFKAKYRVEQRKALEAARQAEIEAEIAANQQAVEDIEDDILEIQELIAQAHQVETSNLPVIGDVQGSLEELQTTLDLAQKAKQDRMNEQAILNAIVMYFF